MSDISQSTVPDTLDLRSTPPTSTGGDLSSSQPTSQSDLDSAEHPKAPAGNALSSTGREHINIEAPKEVQQPQTATRMTVAPTTTTNMPHVGAGIKRTASGEMKLSRSPPLENMTAGELIPHQQKSGNLSSELRARLSYAMVKVQNGWEKQTIDEVENMVSQTTSPTRSVTMASPFRRASKWSNSDAHSSQSSGSSPAEGTVNRIAATPLGSQEDSSSLSGSQTRRPLAAGQGYESFWREHSSNSTAAKIMQARALGSNSSGPSSGQSGNGLLPAPSIYAGSSVANPRRVDQHSQQGQGWQDVPKLSNGVSNSSFLSTSTVPQTPPQRLFARERGSPSEKSSIEQDAVETLVLMSSPGNNAMHHFGSMAAPQRPYTAGGKDKNTERRTPGIASSSGPMHNRSHSQSSNASSIRTTTTTASRFQHPQIQSRNLDKMLDDMIEQMGDRDGSTDDGDEDIIMPVVSPARPIVHT